MHKQHKRTLHATPKKVVVAKKSTPKVESLKIEKPVTMPPPAVISAGNMKAGIAIS